MNSESLQTFVSLAEIKNYTQTANRLFIAQSTVTNRIQDLELEIGYPLFIRNHRQLTLTVEGEHFLEYARRILDLEQTALSQLAGLNRYTQSIRLGTTNTIYDCHLSDPLQNFPMKYPDISLNITLDHSLPLLQMLQDNLLDIAFTYVPYSKNQISCSLFATDHLVLVTDYHNTEFADGIRQTDLYRIPYYYCDFTFRDMGSYIKDLFPQKSSFSTYH